MSPISDRPVKAFLLIENKYAIGSTGQFDSFDTGYFVQ